LIIDQFRLDGRVALVTGASAGIGAAIAVALGEAGAVVACHGNSRSPVATTTQVESAGGMAMALSGDLRERETQERLIPEVLDRFGRLDILVNNAGTIRRAPAVDHSLEDWEAVIEVNLTSVFRLSQLAGGHMLAARSGKIINIASLLSFQGGITVTRYAAANGDLAQLNKDLDNEWAVSGVNVNTFALIYVRTRNTEALLQNETRNRHIL